MCVGEMTGPDLQPTRPAGHYWNDHVKRSQNRSSVYSQCLMLVPHSVKLTGSVTTHGHTVSRPRRHLCAAVRCASTVYKTNTSSETCVHHPCSSKSTLFCDLHCITRMLSTLQARSTRPRPAMPKHSNCYSYISVIIVVSSLFPGVVPVRHSIAHTGTPPRGLSSRHSIMMATAAASCMHPRPDWPSRKHDSAESARSPPTHTAPRSGQGGPHNTPDRMRAPHQSGAVASPARRPHPGRGLRPGQNPTEPHRSLWPRLTCRQGPMHAPSSAYSQHLGQPSASLGPAVRSSLVGGAVRREDVVEGLPELPARHAQRGVAVEHGEDGGLEDAEAAPHLRRQPIPLPRQRLHAL